MSDVDLAIREAELIRLIRNADKIIGYMQEMALSEFPPSVEWRKSARKALGSENVHVSNRAD